MKFEPIALKEGSEVEIAFDGEPVKARHGESVASALASAGHLILRTTPKGTERGVFCGMGVCRDCLVDVDGQRNVRACMTKVKPGMEIARAGRAGKPATTDPNPPHVTIDSVKTETPDVLVIGAGPAGLAAALAARRAGAHVVLADERAIPGGQYFKQPSAGPTIDAQQEEGRRLVEDVRRAGVDIWPETLVWGAFEPLVFAVNRGGGTLVVQPRAAVYAGGAFERPWPVPGWTLPGVMTTGAAQTMWRTDRRLAGKRVLIAGNGPLNLQVAAELARGGAELVGVVESAAAPRSPLQAARLAVNAPRLALQGLGYLVDCRKMGVPVIYRSQLARIAQVDGELEATIDGAGARTVRCDTVCLGYGFLPSSDLPRSLGARCDRHPQTGMALLRRDAGGATTVDGLFAVGDCTGLGGARVALADGVLAGAAAARHAGFDPYRSAALAGQLRRAGRDAARHRRFQAALWTIFRPTIADIVPAPETVICRCEEVAYGEVEAALAEGIGGAGAVKRRTRVGMGHCQGRYCGALLAAMLERNGHRSDEYSGFAPRLPVKPIAIGSLAREPAAK